MDYAGDDSCPLNYPLHGHRRHVGVSIAPGAKRRTFIWASLGALSKHASTLRSGWRGHGAQGSDESREKFLGLVHLETGGWQALSCRCAGSEARGIYAAERWGGGLVQMKLACAALLSPVRHRHGLEDD